MTPTRAARDDDEEFIGGPSYTWWWDATPHIGPRYPLLRLLALDGHLSPITHPLQCA